MAPDARKHLSFGWGRHFCVGSRVAEMQLRVLWEEILRRYRQVEDGGRAGSGAFELREHQALPVRLHGV